MAETESDQKTEQATEKHLADAFDRGQFARSQEIQTAFVLAAVLGALGFTATQTARDLGALAVGIFSQLATLRLQLDTLSTQVTELIVILARLVGPSLLACVIASLLAGGMQSGFRVTPKALGWHFENINPVAGFGRVYSKASLVRAGIDLLKLVAVGLALYSGLRAVIRDPLFSAPVELSYLGEYLYRATLAFLSRLLFTLGIIAAISYAWERFKTGRDTMMSRQEIRDEHRNAEGSSLLKSAQRRLARRLMQKQMLTAVPTADVVLTNPTHCAVALKYERGIDRAPVVLAKGENQFARRIKAIAAEHGVPMVENKPVARLLLAAGEVGKPIPAGLYEAVAGILAVVYRTHRYYFFQLKSRRLTAAPGTPVGH
jgi:flagellar biosynthetic protein FlhB